MYIKIAYNRSDTVRNSRIQQGTVGYGWIRYGYASVQESEELLEPNANFYNTNLRSKVSIPTHDQPISGFVQFQNS
jgi:hypothetical protein